MRAARSILIIAGLLACAGLVLSSNLWPSSGFTSFARSAVALTIVVCLVSFVFSGKAILPPDELALGKPRVKPPTKIELAEAYGDVTRTYDSHALHQFVYMLLDLPSYLVRINEEAHLDEGPLLRVVTRQQYRIEKRSADVEKQVGENAVLVPLVRPEKGRLLDSFGVTNSVGELVPTLSISKVRGLLVYTLESLLGMPQRELSKVTSNEEAQSAIDTARARLTLAVCGPGPIRKQSPAYQQWVNEALESIQQLPFSQDWIDRIDRFCRQYVDYYVIVGEVPEPRGQKAMLTYSYRAPSERPSTKGLRQRFGLTQGTVDIPINAFAFQVPGYHLQMSADPGLYVFDHHLEQLDSNQHITQNDLQAGEFAPYVRLYHKEGRPNAHLYIRRQGTTADSGALRLKSVIEFREIPPGVLGGALGVALSSTALIVYFALTHLGLSLDPAAEVKASDQLTATLNSDIPALLLALPAFTAALIGSWDSSRMKRTSLTTYMALIGTMVLSLSSALFLVWDANYKLSTEFTLVLPWHQHITTDLVWLSLGLLSTTKSLYLIRQLVSESRHYFGAVKQRLDRQLR